MLRHAIPGLPWFFAALLLVAAPVVAQDTEEAEERGLTSPRVQESLPQNPTDQGTRPPDQLDEDEEPQLYQLLTEVRRSPPTLDAGDGTPRPNEFASEPAKEMPPAQPEDMSLFPEDYLE